MKIVLFCFGGGDSIPPRFGRRLGFGSGFLDVQKEPFDDD
jgi:hypothetical protein